MGPQKRSLGNTAFKYLLFLRKRSLLIPQLFIQVLCSKKNSPGRSLWAKYKNLCEVRFVSTKGNIFAGFFMLSLKATCTHVHPHVGQQNRESLRSAWVTTLSLPCSVVSHSSLLSVTRRPSLNLAERRKKVSDQTWVRTYNLTLFWTIVELARVQRSRKRGGEHKDKAHSD